MPESDHNDAQPNLPVPARPSRPAPVYPVGPWNAEAAETGLAPAAPTLAPAHSFASLFKGFRHRWPLALAAGLVLGASLAAAVWCFLPPQYTAYALLRVASTEPKLLPDNRGGAINDQNFENTQVALLKSRPILQAALRRPKVGELPMVRDHADAAAWLEEELKAAFIDKTDIIKVALTGSSPKEAATLVNAIKDAYMEEGVNAERNQKLAFKEDLQTVYTKSEEKLRGQRAALRGLADSLKSGDSQALTAKQKMALEEYAAMKQELMKLQSQIRNAELTLQVHKAAPAVDSAAIPDSAIEQAVENDPLVLRKKLEVDQVEEKIARASKTFNPGQGPLPKYEEELDTIKKDLEKIKTERRTALAALVADKTRADEAMKGGRLEETLAVWKLEEGKMQTEVDGLEKEASRIGVTSFELELKRAEIDQGEGLLRRLRDEKESLEVELQSSSQRVVVLNAAEVPALPDMAPRIRGCALAGGAGLLLGLFGVSYWDARRRRIRTKEEVAGELGLRVVGTLPALPKPAPTKPNRQATRGRAAEASAVWVASIDAIRAAVLCGAEESAGARVLLVTSALAREGKTTVACHLALSLARAGKRVLLVDCDSRRPRLHRVWDVPAAPGLSETLDGAADAASAVHPGPVEGLSILPIGGDVERVEQALARQTMRQFLDQARSAYDFVLLDSCPVLPVADALALGRLADGVLLSVRPGLSQFPQVAEAFARLADLNIPVLGAVLNGTRLRTGAPEYDYLRQPRVLRTETVEG